MNWEDDYRLRYTLVSSTFHFLLTLIVVVVLYSLIYCRLKERCVGVIAKCGLPVLLSVGG